MNTENKQSSEEIDTEISFIVKTIVEKTVKEMLLSLGKMPEKFHAFYEDITEIILANLIGYYCQKMSNDDSGKYKIIFDRIMSHLLEMMKKTTAILSKESSINLH